MKTERCMTQTELAERWRISEATLERWRTESGGPLFLKLGNQVRYRLQDVETFGEAALRGSNKPDTEVDQGVTSGASHRTLPRLTQPPPKPTRPVTIWLRTSSRRTGFRPVFSGGQR
ncbi:MAG: helix-turn-helix domain-containing protein [Burkholderiaceae bacterium]|nr:helix-turn-helix domain-containing protein [Burkholderiaceae bacterium]